MAKISVVLGGKKLGTYPMNVTPFTVGRHASNHVQIDNPGVSRKHCQFAYKEGQYLVEDMWSSNGTFFNGRKVKRTGIKNGDQVTIGKFVLVFEDTGLEMPPSEGGARPARPLAAPGGRVASGAQLTFQVDPATLRQQMAKAGASATGVSTEARKAAEVAEAFDRDAPIQIKRRRDVGKHVVTALKLVGVTILVSLVVIGILYAVGLF